MYHVHIHYWAIPHKNFKALPTPFKHFYQNSRGRKDVKFVEFSWTGRKHTNVHVEKEWFLPILGGHQIIYTAVIMNALNRGKGWRRFAAYQTSLNQFLSHFNCPVDFLEFISSCLISHFFSLSRLPGNTSKNAVLTTLVLPLSQWL